jgi:hypothetical protein
MQTKRTMLLAAFLGVALLGLMIMGWLAQELAVAQPPPGGGPRFGPPPGPPPMSLAVNDRYVYVLQGPTLYQLDAKDLKEINKVTLEVEKPPLGPGNPGGPGGQAEK